MGEPQILKAPVILCGENLDAPQPIEIVSGQAVVFNRPFGGLEGTNEDGLGVFESGEDKVCLALADGVGGMSKGRDAAALVIEKVRKWTESKGSVTLEECLKKCNQALLADLPRSGTTASVVLIDGASALTCHAGDSQILVVGQRGRIKLKVDAHSPVGVSETLGLIDEEEALHHPKRHFLNNMLGDPALWLENHELMLAARDTILIASDGLWDNLYLSEVIELIRSGDLLESAQTMTQLAVSRMDEPASGSPSKPDDLSFILYRPDPSRLAEDLEERSENPDLAGA